MFITESSYYLEYSNIQQLIYYSFVPAKKEKALLEDQAKLEKHLEDLQISNQELLLQTSQLEQQLCQSQFDEKCQQKNMIQQNCEQQNDSSHEEPKSENSSPINDVTPKAKYDVTARAQDDKILQLQTLLEDRSNTVDVLQSKNSDLLQQLEIARCRIDNFGKSEDEDLRSLQTRKIGRLECSLASAETELQHLSFTIQELEEQVSYFEKTITSPVVV